VFCYTLLCPAPYCLSQGPATQLAPRAPVQVVLLCGRVADARQVKAGILLQYPLLLHTHLEILQPPVQQPLPPRLLAVAGQAGQAGKGSQAESALMQACKILVNRCACMQLYAMQVSVLVCRDEPGWLVATLAPKEGAVGPDYRSAAVPTSERAAAMVKAATPPMWGWMLCNAMHSAMHMQTQAWAAMYSQKTSQQ
jgi:hypothetical protein